MNKSKLVRRTISARKRVRNLAITLLPGDKCSVVNINTHSVPVMSREEAVLIMEDFTKVKHKWSVLLCVFGRCPINGSYWKTLDVAPSGATYSSQINAALASAHDEMISSFNMNQFVSLGWIAKTNDSEFDNNKTYELFKTLGAWDYLAKWEQ